MISWILDIWAPIDLRHRVAAPTYTLRKNDIPRISTAEFLVLSKHANMEFEVRSLSRATLWNDLSRDFVQMYSLGTAEFLVLSKQANHIEFEVRSLSPSRATFWNDSSRDFVSQRLI